MCLAIKVRPFLQTATLALAALTVTLLTAGNAFSDSASDLWKTIRKDSEGLYLTHIPGVFSIHSVRVRPGIATSGTIRDKGGWIHVTRANDPGREMVLERLSTDTLRFLIAPSNRKHPVGFSFETSTGCFTLTARQTPSGRLPLIHLNGYGPEITALPVVFCGNGSHVRVEWQGPFPRVKPLISRFEKKSRKNAH